MFHLGLIDIYLFIVVMVYSVDTANLSVDDYIQYIKNRNREAMKYQFPVDAMEYKAASSVPQGRS